MKRTGRTYSLKACLITVSVWGITPSTASTKSITPSTAPTVRSLLSAAGAYQFRLGPYDYVAQTNTNATQTTYISIVQ